ncbi:MAG TPA: LCP family protein [Acidimicrobiia bacterium]|jgi:LCP family protein required for cell wall assembly
MLRGVAALVTIMLALTGLAASWLAGVHIPFVEGKTYIAVQKLHAAFTPRPDGSNGPLFIMFIGSDLRPGVGGARGDALHLMGINPTLHQATILDIPRDTCADVPGSGHTKINAANEGGNAAQQTQAVASLVGVPVSYAVEVDFAGFMALVDGVGGVDVNIPYPMHDSYSNADFDPGPRHLNGVLALAFARDRHSFPTSDIQRTWDQGYLMIAAIQKLEKSYSTIAGRFQLAALMMQHAQLSGMDLQDLVKLGQVADDIAPNGIKTVTMPSTGGNCLTPTASARALFADFRDDGVLESYPAGTPQDVSPSP